LREQVAKAAPAAIAWLVMLWVSPLAAAAGLVVGGGLFLLTRSLALSICLAALSFPLGVWLIDHPGLIRLALALALALVLSWYYREGLRAES
jgi:hypothetical protein